MQTLTGHDRVEVRVLAEWTPVGLAEGRAATAGGFPAWTAGRAADRKAAGLRLLAALA